MDNTENITVLSLCAGYGGLEIGLARTLQAVLRVVAVEVEAFALANLVAKAETGKLAIEALWPDLRTFPAERFRGCFDIVTAGYPCQPFSVAGKRKGKDDPRHLWPHIERIIEAVRPVWFFGENVSGHLTLGFPTVYRSLRNLGYSVEAGLFSAAECGAPHRRERLFILAHGGGQRWPFQQMRPPNPDRRSKEREQGDQPALCDSSSKTTGWPARPGRPQYEWEEPRVVADSKRKRYRRCSKETNSPNNENKRNDKDKMGGEINGCSCIPTGKGKAQSRLGRTTNRTPCRVDRLRLLGNGVVPQQAEKAFRYLIRKFE